MLKIFTRLFIALAVLSLVPEMLNAQNVGDTIVVQTLDYNSTTRDTMITFPDFSGLTFEKVLMRYNMRCHDAAINTTGGNGIACGEWDYSCNTYLTDSTRTDSVGAIHPDFIITGFSGTTYNYTTNQTYTYYQSTQEEVIYDDIISEVVAEVGAGNVSDNTPLDNAAGDAKSQYLITADELTTGGLSAGAITGLRLNIDALGDEIQNLRISIKETTAAALNPASPDLNGFSTVYYLSTNFDALGDHQFNFSSGFNWDGTSNLIVEFTYEDATGSGSNVLSENIPDHGIASTSSDFSLDFNGNSHVDIANPFETISDQITISCWVYGNEDIMPANSTIFEGTDDNNLRQVNVHLPWSNSRVYWDCGNDGGGYDRIDKAANASDFEGKWNHWAFTKNATTGSMKMYLNGTLWHSGSGMTKLIDLQGLRIGSALAWVNGYFGKVDEFRIWDKELPAEEIANFMHSSITESHPSYSNLIAYYKFNEGSGAIASDEMGAHEGTLVTGPIWRQKEGQDIMMDFTTLSERPNFKVLQGEYATTVIATDVVDSLPNGANTVTAYGLDGTDVEELSTNVYFEAGDMPIYNEAGDEVGTVNVPTENTIEINELEYFAKYPMKFEIMSFVTPYGIQLDMTPTGKTWTFEMTDFLPILNGSKRMTMERGGQWQEEMDIQFLFIVGTPPREVLDIQQIWRNESRNYQSITSNQYFPPRDVPTHADGEHFKVRTAITGHGQQGEFIPRTHYIDINGGTNEFSWQVWKECAANPLYPQGGTWVYDRAGWCPGMATDIQESDITSMVTPGETVNIDYGLNSATGDSRYIVNSQLVTYGGANFELDASLLEVRKPSQRFEFDRFGTICHNPEVVIQNKGGQTLTSLTINYWVNDAITPETYNWTGSLEMMETAIVELPTPATLWESVTLENNTFHAEVYGPNNGADEYIYNDVYHSTFSIPDVVPNHFLIMFRSNNQPGENDYQLYDDNGNIIFERDNMSSNTLYRDTLELNPGCYRFQLNDSDDDGINWWANNDGAGYVRFKEVGGPTFNYFEADFGDDINYEFTVEFPLAYEEAKGAHQFEAYPNPTKDQLNIALSGFDSEVFIRVFNNLGQLVLSQNINTTLTETTSQIDMRNLGSGVYVVQATDGTRTSTQKVVKE